MARAECWLAQFAPDVPCEGRLVKCHLLPRAVLRREFRYGLIRVGNAWLPAQHPALEIREGQRWRLERLLHDDQLTVPGCGGITGAGGHHGMLDHSRTLRVPREAIPSRVEGVVRALGLVWWLDREYGQRTEGGG